MNKKHSAACATYSQSTLPLLLWSYLKHLLPYADPFYNHFCTHNEVQAHVEGDNKRNESQSVELPIKWLSVPRYMHIE